MCVNYVYIYLSVSDNRCEIDNVAKYRRASNLF